MDAVPEDAGHDPVVVTGAGHVLGASADPTPWLKVRKNRKFMGVQDALAVAAAGRALDAAGLGGAPLGERTGLYATVGYIPFEQVHTDLLLQNSVDADGKISMARFSTDAFAALNPLLTFQCLSNMPAFHISVNFDLQGPYAVTYPGAGQLYLALEEAVAALSERVIDRALLVGVAHQRNALVEHHFARLVPPVPADRLADAAGCLVLERAADAGGRARARLERLLLSYEPAEAAAADERVDGLPVEEELGPASLPLRLSDRRGPTLRHEVFTRDGIRAASTWGPA